MQVWLTAGNVNQAPAWILQDESCIIPPECKVLLLVEFCDNPIIWVLLFVNKTNL